MCTILFFEKKFKETPPPSFIAFIGILHAVHVVMKFTLGHTFYSDHVLKKHSTQHSIPQGLETQ